MKMSVRNLNSMFRVSRSAFRAGFTLIELLTVIVIIGILAAILAPAVSHLIKGDSSLAATRQMLDDCARARQLAISQRTTVFMVFIHTNFWLDPMRPAASGNQWNTISTYAPLVASSTTTTQMYSAQLTGYAMLSMRSIGDQPGNYHPRDLVKVRTLPDKAFIPPLKFNANRYPGSPFLIQTNFPVYGFLRTNGLPLFPTTDITTNANYMNQIKGNPSLAYPTVAYIAFNHLGQLTPGDGSLLPYDENIPLAYGTVSPARDAKKNPTNAPPVITENPPGNSTNISYNIIHIDRLTGRARLERQEVQ